MRWAAALLLAAAPAAAQDGWIARLPAIAPALNACLGGDAHAMVTWVEDTGEGRLRAYLQREDGSWLGCVVAPDGTAPHREPIAATPLRPGEGMQVYMLERRCVDARRVDAPGGGVLGWIAYPSCR